MRVVFRVDASIRIGTGHVMRCLTLADALHEKGAEVCFVCRDFEGFPKEAVSGRGHGLVLLPRTSGRNPGAEDGSSYEDWLGVSWEEDARETLGALKGKGSVDWLVVDHYALDWKWEGCFRDHAERVMVIDDLADRVHDCDLILDQNMCESLHSRYDALVPEKCRKYLGPRFVLLRKEFYAAQQRVAERKFPPKRIMINFGGSDVQGQTEKTISGVLAASDDAGLTVDAVFGASFGDVAGVRSRFAGHENVNIIYDTNSISEIMARADMAIGAGGITVWERIHLGLPTIAVSVAENQREVLEYMHKNKALFFLGSWEDVSEDDISRALLSYVPSSEAMEKIGVGDGLSIVLEEMFNV